MFVGHYAVGFAIKQKVKEIPLWLIFIAVQFIDILAFILVLIGIERISYNSTENPFLRTFIEYVPFSHSLSSNFIISIIVLIVFWKFKNRAWGIALSIAVLSHWPIDFIAHTNDMPLLFNSFKVALGLWNYPWTAFLIEICFLIGAGYYLYRDSKEYKRPIILITFLVLLYAPTMFAPEGEVPVKTVCITSLSFYTIFGLLAWWVEKKKSTLKVT